MRRVAGRPDHAPRTSFLSSSQRFAPASMTSATLASPTKALAISGPEVAAPHAEPLGLGAVDGKAGLGLERLDVDPARPGLLHVGIVEQRQLSKAEPFSTAQRLATW